MSWRLETARLLLIPGTAELVQADLAGRGPLQEQLQAIVPENWPPELLVDALPTFHEQLRDNPAQVGWWLWYWLVKPEANRPAVLIGSGGFCGLASEGSTTETGYSVLDPYQRHGYASEAVAALMRWAFSHPGLQTVVAHTFPHRTPSIRVLEKNGFQQVGPGEEPGTIRIELPRPAR
jgi:[ribosomal protein S5]-alanine N-acetyltransferase